VKLDVVTLFDADAAVAAVCAGTIDATFRAVTMPGRRLPDGIEAARVYDEPLQLFTGPAHEFADASAVALGRLAGHRIWMPSNAPGTEWAAYYDELGAEFGLTIDTIGPDFGLEVLLDTIADSSTLATFLSARTPLVWPVGHDMRLIPLRDPTPVYPHSLLWRADNSHPTLAALRDHLVAQRPDRPDTGTWTPTWARHSNPSGKAGGASVTRHVRRRRRSNSEPRTD
ncbi:LysR substrate-binding domain-containing protein, partial [Streptomyces sp. SID3343]|uniref:LysR substrate-binding domain-containing protein n=1 Tax=Streptomyces sp. SID3343 TaxID=2690260 RepID=UPI0013BFF5BA